MTHELTLNQDIEEELKMKKSIALKVAIQGDSEESSYEEESESDVAFLAKKLRKFMRKKKSLPRKKTIDREEIEKEKESVTYYECKKPGHFRVKCPLLKKNSKRKERYLW